MNYTYRISFFFISIASSSYGLSNNFGSPATKSTWSPSVWKAALSDLPAETRLAQTLPVTGKVPFDLSGILYKNGPAKFSRRGQSYEHWLEGDGAVLRLEFDNGKVMFSSRFVRTNSFQADENANAITIRGTFGTNKNDGSLNALDIRLKNPANTNAIRIGDHVLALAEVGLPYKLNASTLETLGMETFESRLRNGITAATIGSAQIDKLLGFGHAVVAHVRRAPFRDPNAAPRLVVAGVQQHVLTGDTEVRLLELNHRTGIVLSDTERVILEDTGFPPHDFCCTLSCAIWVTCPAHGDLTPFFLGQQGPAQCLSFRPGATSTLHIVERGQQPDQPSVKRLVLPGPIYPVVGIVCVFVCVKNLSNSLIS